MQSKFPFSMENIPRQTSFGCLSLKLGCVFSALTTILYTIFALAQCTAALEKLVPGAFNLDNLENILMYSLAIVVIGCHCITLVLSAIMLVGTLREKSHLMRPWVVWTSFQVLVNVMLFVFWVTTAMVSNNLDNYSLLVYGVAFLGLMVRFYMLMLVASYYKQLVEEGFERLKTLLNNDTWYTA